MLLIGPHVGRELELMLCGTKPAALVLPYYDKFLPYVTEGRFVARFIVPCHSVEYAVAQPHEAWRIDEIEAIFAQVRASGSMLAVDHMCLGRLLGYTWEQIGAFVEHSARVDKELRARSVA